MYHSDIQSKIEMLPDNVKQQVSDYVEFLLSKYYKPLKKKASVSRNKKMSKFRKVRGAASVKMSTDEIMILTRGDE